MREIVFYICIPLFFGFCYTPSRSSNSDITAVMVNYKLPVVKEALGEAHTLVDSCNIYYVNNLIIYEIPYEFDSLNNDILIARYTRNNLFIFENNEPFGFYYDDGRPSFKKRLNVDFLLSQKMFSKLSIFYSSIKNKSHLIESITNASGDIAEKYIPHEKVDRTYPDTVYLSFSKQLSDMPFSLIKELDNERGAKMNKLRFFFKESYNSNHKTVIPAHELSFEFEKKSNINEAKIRSYINRFLKDHGKT